MKLSIHYFSLLLALWIAGCENTDYLQYNPEQKNKVYFSEEEVKFEYGFNMDNPIDLSIPVEVIGFVDTGMHHPVAVKINQELTTAIEGVHFNLSDTTFILKDSVQGVVNLDFIKSNLEMDRLYTLTLELLENDAYRPTDRKRCTISFGNLAIPAPAWWKNDKVGEYNQEKYILFVELFHKTQELSPIMWEKIKKGWGPNLEGTTTNLLLIYDYQSYLKKYILEPMYRYYQESGDEKFAIPNPS